MNLKILSLLPGFRYSAVPSPVPVDADTTRLTVDPSEQIPPSQSGVDLHKGIRCGDGLRLDLLTPSTKGPHPLVVYIPGGGFVASSRRMALRERAFIAAAGYAVASVEYRTTRQGATYVDGLADISAAIDHLVGGYPVAPSRIAVWGESAGGYLAALAGLTDPRVRAVVDMFGASDLSQVAEGFDERMHAAVADPRNPIRRYGAFDADPAAIAGADAPPFLLLHGDDDRVIPPAQTLRLHRALREAGADSTHYLLQGAGHGHIAFTRAQSRHWTSVRVMAIIEDFLAVHLRS